MRPIAHQVERLLPARQRRARQLDLRVERAQREIRLGSQPGKRQGHDFPRVARAQCERARGFERAAQFAPEIELERCPQRKANVVPHQRHARRDGRGGQRAEPLALRRSVQIDLGQEGRAGLAQIGIGLLDARDGDTHVGVARERAGDESVEPLIAVQLPPLGRNRRRAGNIGRRVGIGAGQVHGGTPVVGPDGGAGAEHQDQTEHERRTQSHVELSNTGAPASRFALRRPSSVKNSGTNSVATKVADQHAAEHAGAHRAPCCRAGSGRQHQRQDART